MIQIRQSNTSDASAIARVRVESWRAAYRGIVPNDFLAGMDAAEWADGYRRFTDSHRQDELRSTPAPLHTRVRMPMPQGGIGHAEVKINDATSGAEPADQFYGASLARITDPHNHQWPISTHIEDLTPDQIADRLSTLAEG